MQMQLPEGLILRSLSEGGKHDRERLAPFYAEIFSQTEKWREEDDLMVESMMGSDHPTMTPDDLWVVVDPARDEMIVSATVLIPQTWRYESIDLPVGRPELVATHPDYRHRGLVRALFQAAHERSAVLGHNVQAITGITHFYRQFGYGMAVDLGPHATFPISSVPKGDPESYTLRPAVEADFPLLDAWDAYMAPQFTLSVKRDAAHWRYVLLRPEQTIQIIEDRQGIGVGYLILHRFLDEPVLFCNAYIVGDQTSYLATFADVLRGMKTYVETCCMDGKTPQRIHFESGQTEALDILLNRTSAARVNQRHYAWYLRAVSPARLIMDIKPVLEQRLQHSGAQRYTGELKIDFYNMKGLRLLFDRGCITGAEDIVLRSHEEREACDSGFPWDSFLSLVFGYRTFEELHHILPDCFANARAEVLFDALFLMKPSRLFPV